MKIMLTADIHVEHSIKHDNERGAKSSILTLDVLGRIMDEERPDVWVINGDFFDDFGNIQSDIAVEAREFVEERAKRGIKVVFVVGNHEWPDVDDLYFGRSIITALFRGHESSGIYVVDAKARLIRLAEDVVLMGLPYRESYEHFERDCLAPIADAVERGEVDTGKDKIVPCWHVGLPFGQAWRGDEDVNGWITADHPAIQLLFSMADNRRLFLGHYHGPADVPFITESGDQIGIGTYIGSPATRSRSESGQDKRVLIWEDGTVRSISTHLALDSLVTSVEDAGAHLASLVGLFGEDVLHIAKVTVNLGEGASLDDFNIAKAAAKELPGYVVVLPPTVKRAGRCDHLIQRHLADPNYTRDAMEVDFAHVALRDHFRGNYMKGLSDAEMDAAAKLPEKMLVAALGSDAGVAAAAREELLASVPPGGALARSISESDTEMLQQLVRIARTSRILGQIAALA